MAPQFRGKSRVLSSSRRWEAVTDEERVRTELEGVDQVGLSPKARQIRLTALWLVPVALAIERIDQWVASADVSSKEGPRHRWRIQGWHPLS